MDSNGIPGWKNLSAIKTEATAVKDIDGNVYNTVQIGDQLWFAENLRTTHYNDGAHIQHVTDGATWSGLTTGARVYYDNDSTQYDTIYGALYNWSAVKTGKLCPTDWHVATEEEWTVLTDYLGGEDVAGGKLKEAGTVYWYSPNIGATDEVGFKALPGGLRSESGSFSFVRNYGYWWSAAPSLSNNSWGRVLGFGSASVSRNFHDERNGFSVRCLRD
jgi:uncharacterized protein (TIGR02145 family)